MFAKMSSQDQRVYNSVVRQLTNRGVRAPCKVVVSNRDGSITLSGQIEYEHQRRTAVRAAQNTPGVKRVLDQLHVISKNSPAKQRGFAAPSLQL
jgi:osmotically-inducible protein OsmY